MVEIGYCAECGGKLSEKYDVCIDGVSAKWRKCIVCGVEHNNRGVPTEYIEEEDAEYFGRQR